jgi:hypothetical protein
VSLQPVVHDVIVLLGFLAHNTQQDNHVEHKTQCKVMQYCINDQGGKVKDVCVFDYTPCAGVSTTCLIVLVEAQLDPMPSAWHCDGETSATSGSGTGRTNGTQHRHCAGICKPLNSAIAETQFIGYAFSGDS